MFQVGDVLCNKYELKKRFNKGGFSSVWLATDLKAKRDFAIKIYAQENGLDEDGIEEFRQEFNLVVNLTHSNIFKPLTYDIEGDRPFLVMPYCEKGSASSLIGKISEEEAWKFAHDVAAGLAYLHDKKDIVHQDIKPGNILKDDDGKFMITDFGISTRLHETLRMTVRQAQAMRNLNYGCGTPEYMGPERWPDQGYNPPDKPIFGSDIWSLGATLFELLTGKVPYKEVGGAMQRKTHTIPDIPGNYSSELKKLVNLCLSEEVWNRPSAQQIADCALEHKAPIVHPRPKKWRKKAGLGGVAAVILGCAFWLLQPIKDPPHEPKNPNDSILLARVQEANMIVKEQFETPDRYKNYAIAYVRKLAEAGNLYLGTDTLDVTDSIRSKGRELWSISQNIIDEEYQQFLKIENDYRNKEAESAADSFALRREEIKKYVSVTINQ